MPRQQKRTTWILIGLVLIGLVAYGVWQSRRPGQYDQFAACLKEKNAIFYGAFWCPHCRDQKKLFGKSAKRLPYVECSTPNGNSQTSICKEKKVENYPTWEFGDNSRETGLVPLAKLAAKTGCTLPQ